MKIIVQNYGYLIILVCSIILTFISIIIEYNYNVMGQYNIKNLSSLMLNRIAHYYGVLYMSFYSLFLNTRGINSLIYLALMVLSNVQWCIMGCCFLTFFELNEYENLDYKQYTTHFNPFMEVFFRDYSNKVFPFIGYLIIANIFFILWSNSQIAIEYKLLYLLIFAYSVYTCVSGNNVIWDWIELSLTEENPNVLQMKKTIERAESDNHYPSEDHMFFKYLINMVRNP